MCSEGDGPVLCKGLCKFHYDRKRRGIPFDAPRKRQSPKGIPTYDRVIALSVWEGDCFVFTGARDPNGYGRIGLTGIQKTVLAHRVVAAHHLGESDRHVLHSCDNPPCVRIEHLRYGTDAENVRDAMERGRTRGLFKARLSDADVAAIRADVRKQVIIAADYGIDPSHVSKIKSGAARR